jgi:uncharacterized protein YycO
MRGDIILVKNYSFLGRQIRKVTGGNYNHVGMFISNNKLIEAMFSGVKITDITGYEIARAEGKLDFDIYRFKNISQHQIDTTTSFLLDQVGCKYDFLQLLSIFIFFVFHINRTIEPIDIRKAFICSELIAKALEIANIKISEEVDVDNITPFDIEYSEKLEKIT